MWCMGRPVTSQGRSFRFIGQTLRADRESHSVPPPSVREARSEQSSASQVCNKPTTTPHTHTHQQGREGGSTKARSPLRAHTHVRACESCDRAAACDRAIADECARKAAEHGRSRARGVARGSPLSLPLSLQFTPLQTATVLAYARTPKDALWRQIV